MMLCAVDLQHRWALTADNRLVTVWNMTDETGRYTDDPAAAVVFTAGEGDAIFAYAVCEIRVRTIH